MSITMSAYQKGNTTAYAMTSWHLAGTEFNLIEEACKAAGEEMAVTDCESARHFLNGFIKYCNEHTGTWKATRTARDPLGVLLPTDKRAIIQGQSFPVYQDERGWYYLIRRDPGTVKVLVEKQSAKHCHQGGGIAPTEPF